MAKIDDYLNQNKKNYIKPTRYQGYYIDIRDGVRCGITFTYECDGKGGMLNEKEESVVKLIDR